MAKAFSCTHSDVLATFRASVNAEELSNLTSILDQKQRWLVNLMLRNTSGVRSDAGVRFARSLDGHQIQQLRAMIKPRVLCLIVLMITLEMALHRGSSELDATLWFFQLNRQPSITSIEMINPGGCSGSVFNDIFLRNKFFNPDEDQVKVKVNVLRGVQFDG